MKVLVVMPLAEQKGGAELAFLHLMQYGRQIDIEWLTIFFEPGPLVAEIQALGIKTQVVESGRLRQPHKFISTVIQIAAIARQWNANVIFSWMTKAQLYSGIAAILTGLPALWFQHGYPSNRNWIDKVATWLPSCGVLACSQAVSNAQSAMYPARPIRVTYPGVDLEKFNALELPSPQELRQGLGIPANTSLIGIFGRLQSWKGMHTLVRAMPLILKVHPSTHCVVVGGKHDLEPEYPQYLENQIKQLGIQDKITLTGYQSNIPEWMQAMDVIVHASNYEPFGMVIVEAMALGKPVVASAAGGANEIIVNECEGLLVPPDDVSAMANAIIRYLNDRELVHAVSEKAQKRATDFSSQSFAKNCIDAIWDFVANSA